MHILPAIAGTKIFLDAGLLRRADGPHDPAVLLRFRRAIRQISGEHDVPEARLRQELLQLLPAPGPLPVFLKVPIPGAVSRWRNRST